MATIVDEVAHGAQITSTVVWATKKQQDRRGEAENMEIRNAKNIQRYNGRDITH